MIQPFRAGWGHAEKRLEAEALINGGESDQDARLPDDKKCGADRVGCVGPAMLTG